MMPRCRLCPMLLAKGAQSSNHSNGGIGTSFMTKMSAYLDLGLAQNAVKAVKSLTPYGSLSHQIYCIMTNHGFDGKDFLFAFKLLQD
ncbi:hypothetical protein DPMN_084106 [Dreissena polymorpha]|uniref:3-hydroxyisobutyrate dehydrogenase-like NAD-binding domain-containing protein n=1 Tax=Dreissena polymorpha TaxID=45954 RepID=A0A9D3YDR9_DREPO|nr:hypothetical protein DPMN_084106 [Dreissena polymorpha]